MQRCFTSCANFLLNSLSFAGRSQFLKTLTVKRSLAPSEIWDGSQKDFRTLLSRPFSYVDIRYVLRIFTSLASSRPRSRVARSLESSFSSHLPKVLAFVSSLLSKYWSQSQDHLDLAVSWSKIQDQDLIPWHWLLTAIFHLDRLMDVGPRLQISQLFLPRRKFPKLSEFMSLPNIRKLNYMRPIVTDRVAWSVGRSVGLSVTLVSPAKTAEPIEMPFGLRTRVSPRNHVLDGVQILPWLGAILRGKGRSIVKHRDTLQSHVRKRLNRSRCRWGCGLEWAQRIVC